MEKSLELKYIKAGNLEELPVADRELIAEAQRATELAYAKYSGFKVGAAVQERKKKRSATVPLSMEINLFEDKDNDTKQIKMLYDRIHRLKPFDRAIVLLWLESMSYEEIAAIVGISVKNVSVRLFRIKEELKQMSNN